jgi:hypothetical protein
VEQWKNEEERTVRTVDLAVANVRRTDRSEHVAIVNRSDLFAKKQTSHDLVVNSRGVGLKKRNTESDIERCAVLTRKESKKSDNRNERVVKLHVVDDGLISGEMDKVKNKIKCENDRV